MKLSAHNFFYVIKQLVMGGGREKDGTTPRNDAGFLKDMNYSLGDLQGDSGAATLTAATGTASLTINDVTATPTQTLINNNFKSMAVQINAIIAKLNGIAAETNLKISQIPASTNTVGTVNVVIPRDYDELTDSFALHMGVAMSGATDVPGLSATVYKKTPGSSIATVATGVTAKIRGGKTAAALSSAEQVVIFSIDSKGLLMDDALTIVITSDAHTTDNINVYYVQPVYRSTLVAYHESVGGTRDGKDGTFLR